jgi:short subunit dehydrogenase-like uncharacterized protein
MKWMIYGANGYTGKRIAEEAKNRGMTPVLAGRTEANIRPIAESLGFEWRAFDLTAPQLDDIDLVLHCAGPFSHTSKPLADALIPKGKHYLDITGEIEVFESLFARKEEAKASGSMVIPGVGFDVVPTDCLAAQLKEKLPDATHLEMAMAGDAVVSPGTMKSMVEGFAKGGWIRENGKLKNVPPLFFSRRITFSRRAYDCSSIPWGDVSTAYYSTGIPNIRFYATAPPWSKFAKPVLPLFQTALRNPMIQNGLKALIGKTVKGPSNEHLNSARMQIWGEVRNMKSQTVESRMEVIEGYRFTVLSSLKAVEKILSGQVKPGVHTPSLAFGVNFVDEVTCPPS